MTLRSELCDFRLVSDTGHSLVEAGDRQALVLFTRQTLSCPRLAACPFGDYCTIFSASLLVERNDTPAEDDE